MGLCARLPSTRPGGMREAMNPPPPALAGSTRAKTHSDSAEASDEVFEEEESEDVLGDLARHCHPDCVRRRRIEARRAFRQAVSRCPEAEEHAN